MGYTFTSDQIATARQVLAAAPNATPTEQLALMEAGLVESGMQNLNYGDRDSRGVFQERPSQGWTNVNNITAATQQIFAAMNKSLTDPGAMAQSAERSAYPARYDQMQGEAQALLQAAGGGNGGTQAQTTGINLNPLDAVSGVFQDFTNWIDGIAVRLGLVIFGAVFIIVGLILTVKDTSAGKVATKVGKYAVLA